MDILKGLDLDNLGRPQDDPDETRPRILGSPRPPGPGSHASAIRVGMGSHEEAPDPPADAERATPVASARRESADNFAPTAPAGPLSGLQKAINMLRMAVPIVQRILPLIDGQIATAVSNVLAPYPHAPSAQQSSDSLALKDGLLELKTRQRDLRDRLAEQNISLKRVEDRLDKVREATDRNTMEQQEVVEDLKKLSSKVRVLALAGLGLLVVSILLNGLLLGLFIYAIKTHGDPTFIRSIF